MSYPIPKAPLAEAIAAIVGKIPQPFGMMQMQFRNCPNNTTRISPTH
jgi:hypothetical protein